MVHPIVIIGGVQTRKTSIIGEKKIRNDRTVRTMHRQQTKGCTH